MLGEKLQHNNCVAILGAKAREPRCFLYVSCKGIVVRERVVAQRTDGIAAAELTNRDSETPADGGCPGI